MAVMNVANGIETAITTVIETETETEIGIVAAARVHLAALAANLK
jgi:hypothetical protein